MFFRSLLAGLLWLTASAAQATPIIPAGRESEVLEFLEPLQLGVEVGNGCSLASVEIDHDRIGLRFRCTGATEERIDLAFPGTYPGAAPAGPVDLIVGAHTPGALIDAVAKSFTQHSHSAAPWVMLAPPESSERRGHEHATDAPYPYGLPLAGLLLVFGLAKWRWAGATKTWGQLKIVWRDDRTAMLATVAVWCVAAVLRLSFPADIEFKGDEDRLTGIADGIWRGDAWPLVGIRSSAGVANPGASVWVFMLQTWLTGADSPIALARCVAAMSLIALALVLWHAWRVPRRERALWLWTGALVAVNPLGIILQRKIWQQSVLPLFCVLAYLAWRARARRSAAFAWGVLAMLLGQIHMSGFFFAGSFVLATLAINRRATRWGAFAAGAAVGLVPMLPWLLHVWTQPQTLAASTATRIAGFSVWRMWCEDALGRNLEYSLGPQHLQALLASPVLRLAWWTPLIVIAAAVLAGFVRRRATERVWLTPGAVAHHIAFVAYLGVMALAPFSFFRHYLIVAYPFEQMTLALVVRARWALALIWTAQLMLSVGVLWYLHVHHGAPGADFGYTYGHLREMKP